MSSSQLKTVLEMGPLLLWNLWDHRDYYYEDIRSPEDEAAYEATCRLIDEVYRQHGEKRRIRFPLPAELSRIYWLDILISGLIDYDVRDKDYKEIGHLTWVARNALNRLHALYPIPDAVQDAVIAFHYTKDEQERLIQRLVILKQGWEYSPGYERACPDPIGSALLFEELSGSLSAHARIRLARVLGEIGRDRVQTP